MLSRVLYILFLFALCVIAIIINQFYEDYKVIGSMCFVGMFVIVVIKEKKKVKK